MKKVIFCLLILGIGMISCNSKKYSKCCYFSGTQTVYNGSSSYTQPFNEGGCLSNQTKKEIEAFEANNSALSDYNKAVADPVHYSNPTYFCK